MNAVEDMTQDKSQNRCVRADGSENSCVQADRLQKSCVQADGLNRSCVQADGLQNSCVQADGSEKSQKSCVRADGVQKSCVRADESEKSQKSCVQADGSRNSCGQAEGSKNSCVRGDGLKKSCVQADGLQKSRVRKSYCVGVWKNGGGEIIANIQRNRNCQDADVKPSVRDPIDDDKIPVESGAEMTPVPHEPSEFEKLKHQLTRIPFQPWRTSCVKSKAQAEPHKRTERIIEDSELPAIQCDYLMLKDVAATSGLKVLSMYVRTLGYGMSTVVEMKGLTDTFATRWAVKNVEFPWTLRRHSAV